MLRCADPRFVIAVDLAGAREAIFARDPTAVPELSSALRSVAGELGYASRFPDASAAPTLNAQSAWTDLGVPTLLLADAAYPFTATLADTIEQVDGATLEAVGRTLERWVETGASFTTPQVRSPR